MGGAKEPNRLTCLQALLLQAGHLVPHASVCVQAATKHERRHMCTQTVCTQEHMCSGLQPPHWMQTGRPHFAAKPTDQRASNAIATQAQRSQAAQARGPHTRLGTQCGVTPHKGRAPPRESAATHATSCNKAPAAHSVLKQAKGRGATDKHKPGWQLPLGSRSPSECAGHRDAGR